MTGRHLRAVPDSPREPLPRVGLARMTRARPLRQHEAAFVLEIPQREVRNMLRRGDLRTVWAGRVRTIAADELAARVCDDLLALHALQQIVAGELDAPRAGRDTALPPTIAEYIRR